MPQPFYSTDLTDAEWEKIAHLLPAKKALGNKRSVNFRNVVNAIFYRIENGIKWRALPADFPAWETVYGYYQKWLRQGIWEAVNRELLRQERQKSVRDERPRRELNQWPIGQAGSNREQKISIDGNKKLKRRERHLLVDGMR